MAECTIRAALMAVVQHVVQYRRIGYHGDTRISYNKVIRTCVIDTT